MNISRLLVSISLLSLNQGYGEDMAMVVDSPCQPILWQFQPHFSQASQFTFGCS